MSVGRQKNQQKYYANVCIYAKTAVFNSESVSMAHVISSPFRGIGGLRASADDLLDPAAHTQGEGPGCCAGHDAIVQIMQQRGGVAITALGNDALCLIVSCAGCGFGPWSQQVALPEQPVGEVVGAVGVILVIGVDVEQELQIDRNGSGDIDLVEQREEHLCQSQQLWVLRGDVMMQAQSVVQHRAQVIDIELIVHIVIAALVVG